MSRKIISKLTYLCDNLPYQTRVKIIAAIADKNKIYSISSNKLTTDPFHLKWNPYPYPHAEVSVIKQFISIYDQEELKNCTLFVIRRKALPISHNLNIEIYGHAKPCIHCREALQYYKIPKIIYSTDEQTFIKIREYH